LPERIICPLRTGALALAKSAQCEQV